jgi:hypothetical protein
VPAVEPEAAEGNMCIDGALASCEGSTVDTARYFRTVPLTAGAAKQMERAMLFAHQPGLSGRWTINCQCENHVTTDASQCKALAWLQCTAVHIRIVNACMLFV